ncbi:hypothetical protein VN97_g7603 [Penicillium thymicola]|uniref:Uncharacterized protein n=1 Tax=Penicillium thymicola TaxID=293382 RepID=A0AAI9TFC8_PENTH|nr:hypothetical protein VN97_g7603 [Penicillium thymicola]
MPDDESGATPHSLALSQEYGQREFSPTQEVATPENPFLLLKSVKDTRSSTGTGDEVCHRHITLSLVITYNSLPYKDSPTPKLAAKRSTKYSSDSIQIQFRFNSDSIQIQFRFTSDSIYFSRNPYTHFKMY